MDGPLLLEVEPTRDGVRLYVHGQVADQAAAAFDRAANALTDLADVAADQATVVQVESLTAATAVLPGLDQPGGATLDAADLGHLVRACAVARTHLLQHLGVQHPDDLARQMQQPGSGRTLAALTLLVQSLGKFRLTGPLRVTSTAG